MSSRDFKSEGKNRVSAGDFVGAVSCFDQAIRKDPNDAETWYQLGYCHSAVGSVSSAVAALSKACELGPNRVEFWGSLGNTLQLAGMISDAGRAFRRGMDLVPAWHAINDNYLFNLHFDEQVNIAEIAREHEQWGQRINLNPCPRYANNRNPDRKLRVGFVSPDFREHSVAKFIEPLITNLANYDIHSYVYSESVGSDEITERLRDQATGWCETAGVSTGQLSLRIYRDQIDVLIDLAGHTAFNRLDVFAFQPAPIQMSYLGYPFPTGLPTIQYWIADDVIAPTDMPLPGQLVRLPGHFAAFHSPSESAAEFEPLDSDHHVTTFGIIQAGRKISDGMLESIAQILAQTGPARLAIIRSNHTPESIECFLQRVRALGIDPRRIAFPNIPSQAKNYLRSFNEVDIMLDTFPFGGHTLTCETLWMGVPLVTLLGDRPCGRLSASVLQAINQVDLIARSRSEYVAIAVKLAIDQGKRQQYRQAMRQLMKKHICDGNVFAQKFSEAIREVWRRWCHEGGSPSKKSANEM